MKKKKVSMIIDGEQKPLETRSKLWEALEVAIREDPLERFSSKSECIRYQIIKFVEEIEDMKEGNHE